MITMAQGFPLPHFTPASKSTGSFDIFRRRCLIPANPEEQVMNRTRVTEIPITVALNDTEL